jgi:uncharacterized coiled-coil protein SlyX
MYMSGAPENQLHAITPDTDKQLEPAMPSKQSTRKTIVAFALLTTFANGAVAIHTLPSFDIGLPDLSSLAELLPQHETASVPIPEAVTAALKDIQSAQQQHEAMLKDNESSLQRNTILLQQDTATLDSLKLGLAAQQTDVRKISAQLSMLTAKVDTLQSTMMPEITSSIPRGRARSRLSGMARRKTARLPKPVGPVSVGGAPLSTVPALGWGGKQSPEG